MRNTNYSYSTHQYVSLDMRVPHMHVPVHIAQSKSPDLGNTSEINMLSVVTGRSNPVHFVLIIDSGCCLLYTSDAADE